MLFLCLCNYLFRLLNCTAICSSESIRSSDNGLDKSKSCSPKEEQLYFTALFFVIFR